MTISSVRFTVGGDGVAVDSTSVYLSVCLSVTVCLCVWWLQCRLVITSTATPCVARHAHLKRKWSLELSPGTDRSPKLGPSRLRPRVYRSQPGRSAASTTPTIPICHLFGRSSRRVALINVINNYDLFVPWLTKHDV